MVWRADGPQGSESKKIVWEVAPYLKGKGVDLGAGYFKILPQAISVDNGHHREMFGHNFKADLEMDCQDLKLFATESLDFVFSSHLLEHIPDYKKALKEWWRVLKVGGKLALYLPHKDFYPNIGEPGSNPDHKHDFLPADIITAMEDICSGQIKFDLMLNQDRNEGEEYSMLLVLRKIHSRHFEHSYKKQKPEKSVLVCRFGAFGDLMQASSVFAGLKKQGYHVTLMTSLPGADVISQNPHIDEIMLLEKDQIPNADLSAFWAWQAKRFDKFVNLSESVEGSFLSLPGRTVHTWSPTARERVSNFNYVEMQHLLAGVPHDPQIKFYTTPEERLWAKKQREKMGDFVILWSLAGSSVHKTWAGLDAVIAAVMLSYKDVHVVLVGGPECAILEQGWEKEPRVHLTCGKWSIRESLSFAAEADMVIGPETGVLNSVANEPMPKIVFLSHSTNENLTRDWKNTIALSGKNVTCKGRGNNEAEACHMLHYNWDNCTRHEDGVAQCQVAISVESVCDHVHNFIDIKRREAA